jgi:hypothetical protein
VLGYIATTWDIASAFFASGLIVLVGAVAATVFLRPGRQLRATG